MLLYRIQQPIRSHPFALLHQSSRIDTRLLVPRDKRFENEFLSSGMNVLALESGNFLFYLPMFPIVRRLFYNLSTLFFLVVFFTQAFCRSHDRPYKPRDSYNFLYLSFRSSSQSNFTRFIFYLIISVGGAFSPIIEEEAAG